ncbi:type I polyketide synthase [Kitasatospora sp. NBC_00315]|uniref:type I polyketide synthase n=1 Tax=Kitasatospora sp. NBC_00315 TaxID=2975963 RepID=UPI00324DA610
MAASVGASNEDLVGALRRAAKEVAALRRRNAELTAKNSDPVVVVGMACRYPGGVDSPEALWELVRSGGDGTGDFPADRGWDVESLFDPDPEALGKTYVRRGGFLPDLAGFDAGFFGISPAEAVAMDPQQRLMLEVSWEAFERAGIDPLGLRGSRTGVFAGVMGHDYGRSASGDGAEGFGTGVMEAVVSGRVSYVLGLEGPAVSVDTACSSSLVTLHLAAQALRGGECDLALAGGVTVMATADTFVEFSRQRGLALDGRCKAFGEGADGTGWGEGAGVVVLERLSDARRLGHSVLAVVAGSAVNQDGASNGLTAPNGPSQQRVIRAALASAGLGVGDVDVVEGHGTGTVLGDPIEAQALLATYGQRPVGVEPLWLGSLKSNVGHTQAAAGVGGVIKMVEALRRGVLPRTLGVDVPSSHVDWSAGRVELLAEQRVWPEVGRPRRAAVSSFGLSGTNAHVIIEQAPDVEVAEPAGQEPQQVPGASVWVVSGRTREALAAQAQAVVEWLEADESESVTVADVAGALARRSVFEHRAVVQGADRGELAAALADLAAGRENAALVAGAVRSAGGGTAFVFPGQGSQWLGMGRDLARAHAGFARELAVVAEVVDRCWEHRLLDVVWGADGGLLERTEFAQPALFAVGVALFRVLERCGVTADFVVGHSVGELAAAHVAGVLSLEDAARLVVARGRVMQRAVGGVMAAVSGSPELVEEVLGQVASELGPVVVAAVNGPGSVVVSGTVAAVGAASGLLEAAGCRVKPLVVSQAFHSPLLEPVLEEFGRIAGRVAVSVPVAGCTLVSTLTGEAADFGGGYGSAEYWVRQAREVVRFADAVRFLEGRGVRRFVELGPGALVSAVEATVEQAVEDSDGIVVASLLSRQGCESAALIGGLGRLFVAGVPVSWGDWQVGGRRVDLPTYAFQRSGYWLSSSRAVGDVSAAGLVAVGHPILGAVVAMPGSSGVVLTGQVSRSAQPWLLDHEVLGHVMVPASALVELAVRAGDEVGSPVVRELAMTAPLLVPEQGPVAVQVQVGEPDAAGLRTVEIHSRPGAQSSWVLHAQGFLAQARTSAAAWAEPEWPPTGARSVDVESGYASLADAGYGYGPVFRGVRAVWRRGAEVFAEIGLPAGADAAGFGVHPALLDAVVHAPLLGVGAADCAEVQVPFLWEGVELHAVGASTVRARIVPAGSDGVAIQVADETGALVLTVDALVTRPVSRQALSAAASAVPDGLFEVSWWPVPAAADQGAAVPVVWEWRSELGAEVVASVHAASHAALAAVQAHLNASEQPDSVLAVLTRGAVALPGEDVADVAASAVWGLVRSAQSEHPGRIVLVDAEAGAEVDVALLVASGEPQLVVRGGVAHAARLVRAAATEAADSADPESSAELAGVTGGAVIVTGGTGGVGGVLARRLVAEHGAGAVVLASRRGAAAGGVAELVADLESAGAVVRVVACDVSDRAAVAGLVASVPEGFELRGVVHAAGVLDDGVIGSLTPERIDRVLAAKADAAWFLHEATADAPLELFSVVSSLSGVLGAPGQANYAAANAFLDALAVHRRARGLAGQSVSWGLWGAGGTGGMGDRLDAEEAARIRAGGVLPLSREQAVELFDAALSGGAAHLVGVRWDLAALRRQAGVGELPPVLSGLVPAVRRSAASGESVSQLESRLRALDVAGRRKLLVELVASHVAAVLGHADARAIGPDTAFKDLGLDSLGGVNVRNRLQTASGLSLPASLVFDYPNSAVLADLLLDRLLPDSRTQAAAPTVPAPAAALTGTDPVVVVGMACRYPGGVDSPEALWELVRSGGDGTGDFPADRGWDVESLFDPDPEAVGKSYVRRGGFLADVAGFDAGFFGISPAEAVAMDPQQRLMLEVSWEAFERAGIDPVALRGSRTGVFAGVMGHDYGRYAAVDALDGFGAGVMEAVVSGRVSYVLGLEGPAVSVDTACSSSLVTLHLAVQALRGGECDLALAGGVTVMATADTFVEFSRQRGLALDGRCKAFGEGADGTGWGEGAGVVVLERLSDARRLGHSVLAVVAGSAVNQDGASNGLTAPNGPSQQRVIRAALASAGLGVGDVDVVEGHGTGTVLGDPIEAQALLATYGQRPVGVEPLWLGSLKSNVGHTQAAAGVGGVIKMVEALRRGVLPRTLGVDVPSSHVDWSAGRVELLAEQRVWPEVGRPRRAAVSSFGLSGTNAHVIIEQAPDVEVAEPVEQESQQAPDVEVAGPAGQESQQVPGASVWVVSGRTREALAAQAQAVVEWLEADESESVTVADVAGALARRSVFEHRAVVQGADRGELAAALADLAAGRENAALVDGAVQMTGTGTGTVFVFPGQGSQWLGMGRGLARAHAGFARELAVVAEVVDRCWGHRLLDVVWGADGGLLERTEFAQPVLFAVGVALFRVLERCGVTADFVVGHSVGELAAAHVAGVLSLEDAARLVVARGRVMQRAVGGVMAAVSGSPELVEEVLGQVASELGPVVVAAVNGPGSVVVSGTVAAVGAASGLLEAAGCRVKPLVVSQAFHSPLLEPVLEEFGRVAGRVAVSVPVAGCTLVSTLTGEAADFGGGYGSAEYWVRQAREVVRFADAVRFLEGRGVRRFVELGPGALVSAVEATVEQAVGDSDGIVVASLLSRQGCESAALIGGLGRLFVAGVPVSWGDWQSGGRRVDLPTYAFQRSGYWLSSSRAVGDVSAAGLVAVGHPILGAVVAMPGSSGVVLTGQVSRSAQPWLLDHEVLGHVMVPASALVELAVRAGDEVGSPVVRELAMTAPLLVPERGGLRIHVVVGELDSGGPGGRTVEVHSRPDGDDGEWILHAQGVLADAEEGGAADADGWSESVWPPVGAQPVDVEAAYASLADAGYGYGPAFRGVRAVWRRGEDVFAEVGLAPALDGGAFGIHPALLDAVVHAPLLAAVDSDTDPGPDSGSDGAQIPFLWEDATLHAVGASTVRVWISPVGAGAATVRVVDETGAPVLTVASLVTRPVSQQALSAAASTAPDGLFEVSWSPVTAESTPAVAPQVTVWEWRSEPGADPVASLHTATREALATVQTHLDSADRPDAVLVAVTRGAVALPGEDVADVAASAVWGLVRSVQSEHPGRFVLVDADAEAEVDVALLVASGEPQLVVRGGVVRAARLVRAVVAQAQAQASGLAGGAVIVTGGTGGVGGVLARRLVAEHGAGAVVLASRRGAAAGGVAELVADLESAGAVVRVVACDVSDRAAVAGLVASVPEGFELRGVVHAAGVLDDGVIGSLTPERIDRVLAAKADAAWFLHEATADAPLELFSVVSSLSGVLGAPGQANYAAANAFLDALAVHRRARGLAGQSVSWGLWGEVGGMGGRLSDVAAARVRASGVVPLTTAQAVELFDAAVAGGQAHLVAVRWDLPALRRQAGVGELTPMLAELVPAVRRTAASGESVSQLESRLRALDVAGRRKLLIDLVASTVASVLGHADAAAVGPNAAFKDLGLDSLGGIGVRDRLRVATGRSLPASLVFDYPNVTALAGFLLEQLVSDGSATGTETAGDQLAEVRRLLRSVTPTRPGDAALLERLSKLAEAQRDWSDGAGGPDAASDADGTGSQERRESIKELDIDALIDMGLGISHDRKSDN